MIISKNYKLKKSLTIPPSKSHTIRLIAFALLSKGRTIIRNPLYSDDTNAAIKAAISLGATIKKEHDRLMVISKGLNPIKKIIDVGNSGTTLAIFTSIACLQSKPITFTGDSSIKKRPMEELLVSLKNLGAQVSSYTIPFTIKGPLKGGKTNLCAITSQYLTSLLISLPIINNESIIKVTKLNEKPYLDMTLSWLDKFKIKYSRKSYREFTIKPKQHYHLFNETVPADWSSASFPICAALISNSKLTIRELDLNDTQGDKDIIPILKKMNAKIKEENNSLVIYPSELKGIVLDLNNNPDLLPILSVLACFAKGKTIIKNVAHARIKETDRIKVIYQELRKLGANIQETKSRLVIKNSVLKSGKINAHNDHRIIMSFICLGTVLDKLEITNTSNLDVSYPNFMDIFNETLKS